MKQFLDIPFKVWVRCTTYNHSSYIVESMDGFSMQRTTFPYVCTIIDDASTDGEPEIIKDYIAQNFEQVDTVSVVVDETEDYVLLFARHKENRNCYFAVYFLKYNHYSIKKDKLSYLKDWWGVKYTALCEGDDYWIDPLKLQKQFDLLESDATISFCHHNFYDLDLNGNKTLRTTKIPQRQDMESIATFTATQTLTMFYKNYQPIIPSELTGRNIYTHFFAFRLSEFGDIFYIDEPMAVYRRNPCSIYGTKDAFTKFSMALGNIDNMIYWSKCINRFDVVKILKRRGIKMCFNYFLHFLKRMNPKGICMSIRKAFYVYNL